jgi:putative N6-adenine-specific DNA methylase
MSEQFNMVAKTIFGYEELLEKELIALGAADVAKGKRMVSFKGDLGFLYKANLACRTAIKILKPILQFNAFTEKSLYDNVQSIDWSKVFNLHQTFAIDATVHSEFFNHSLFVSQKVKDAIVDQFRDKYNERPSVDLKTPDIRINIHINEHEVSIALDSSGDSLNKRGYRAETNVAPMNEVLAAGLVMLSDWHGQCDFLDPMCGSGTILIEAAMIAQNIPPNRNRKYFAFMKWNDWNEPLFAQIKENLLRKIKPLEVKITGYDKDQSVIEKALNNIKLAGLEKSIAIKQMNFFQSKKETETPLHILFNPPYNERIDIETETFYKSIGDTFKKNYPGTTAWFITANLEGLRYIGLKASRKIVVANGQLEARLAKYEIYSGTKRVFLRE